MFNSVDEGISIILSVSVLVMVDDSIQGLKIPSSVFHNLYVSAGE